MSTDNINFYQKYRNKKYLRNVCGGILKVWKSKNIEVARKSTLPSCISLCVLTCQSLVTNALGTGFIYLFLPVGGDEWKRKMRNSCVRYDKKIAIEHTLFFSILFRASNSIPTNIHICRLSAYQCQYQDLGN